MFIASNQKEESISLQRGKWSAPLVFANNNKKNNSYANDPLVI